MDVDLRSILGIPLYATWQLSKGRGEMWEEIWEIFLSITFEGHG